MNQDEYFRQLLLQGNSLRMAGNGVTGLKNIRASAESMTDRAVSASDEALTAFFDAGVLLTL